MFGAFAIVAALHARERTGEGQVIDATMIGGQVALLSRQAARYFADGTVPAPEGNVHASIVPYQTFHASDGYVNICCGNNALFERMCRALDLEDLLADARFADNTKRVAHREVGEDQEKRAQDEVLDRRVAVEAHAEYAIARDAAVCGHPHDLNARILGEDVGDNLANDNSVIDNEHTYFPHELDPVCCRQRSQAAVTYPPAQCR